MINKIAHEASAKLLLICSYEVWVKVSDLWLAHGLVLMLVPMSTPFRLIGTKKLRHNHKHKHEKNEHVRFSCAYAYALMRKWKPDLSNDWLRRRQERQKGNRFRPLFSGLAYCPLISGENSHRKHIFSKKLARVEIFENAGFFFTCGRMNTEDFEYDDVIHQKYTIII